MHSRIFQISEEPIKQDDYMEEDKFYVNQLDFMDYCVTVDDPIPSYEWFAREANGIEIDTAAKTLTVISKEDYFRHKYEAFMKAIQKTKDWTLEDFIGFGSFAAMFDIRDNYDDKFGFYAYSDYDGLQTMDSFMRSGSVKDGDVFHLGGVVDYHF